MTIEFQPWPKTPRFNRDVIITEKIDGTNAAIIIEPAETVLMTNEIVKICHGDTWYVVGAQSRKRLIVPGDDNFGFAAWVAANAQALVEILGPGRHFGEWWGSGIQRGYGLTKGEKRFSLFNVERYADVPGRLDGLGIVPELYRGPLTDIALDNVDLGLRLEGSQAADFHDPEGFVIFHTAGHHVYKVLLENDEGHKG